MSELLGTLFLFVVNFITRLGYWGIALGMAFESACIPIPSEIILPFGGYLASTGRLTFWGTVLAGTIGGTLGSVLAYLVGLIGGRPFILKYGRYIFIQEKDLRRAEDWFQRFGEATAFFSRLLPIIRTFISLPCGIANMNFSRFVFYTFLGSLPWSIALTYAGYKMGEHWPQIRGWFHQFDAVLISTGLILIVLYFLKKKRLNFRL